MNILLIQSTLEHELQRIRKLGFVKEEDEHSLKSNLHSLLLEKKNSSLLNIDKRVKNVDSRKEAAIAGGSGRTRRSSRRWSSSLLGFIEGDGTPIERDALWLTEVA